MSYILEALKKSQQERELGQVPTLDDAPFLHEQRPARATYWIIVAVALALLAVLIALYAAFGARILQQGSADPDASLATPLIPSKQFPEPSPDIAQEIEPRIPPTPPAVPKPRATTAPSVAEQPVNQPRSNPAPGRPDPQPEPVAETPAVSALRLPPQTPAIPPDLIGEVQRFKQEILQQDVAPEKRQQIPAPPKPPAPDEAAVPTEDPMPAQQTQVEPQETETPPALEAESAPDFYDLSAEEQAGVPPHRLSVHVYVSDPMERFVILNSREMREGDRNRKGLKVEAITTEGVILEYAGKRFFVNR